jgi:hypothetical protein
MEPRLPHAGADGSAPGSGGPAGDDIMPDSRVWREDRACCCPAQPVVRVIMPSTARRRHSIDLLLCGHHYRVSRQALAAVRAHVEYLPGKADAATVALLGNVHRDHAEVM